MRLIDADALKKVVEDRYISACIQTAPGTRQSGRNIHYGIAIGMNFVRNVIADQPTIDAEPVVRCKDCQERCPNSGVSVQHCTLSGIQTEDDDFCSYGVRKGEMHG